ncbi:MAG: hypothetical protein HY287_17225 [Planctomycetes bacterium]|nr:hypothetical protein [Planctomycetota bacterium]MBI3836069.1 hypothetical protein [Planctomycetota bacterium]
MILGERGSEQYRTRLGLLMLVVGILLLTWASGSWLYRTNVPSAIDGASMERSLDRATTHMMAVRSSPFFLMVALLLLTAFLVGSIIIVRTIRSYRDSVLRKPSEPTTHQDVWSMHRPPRDADDSDLYP